MRTKTRILLLLTFAFSLFVLGGCSEDVVGPEEAAFKDIQDVAQTSVATIDGVTRYDGVIGGENVYAFLVPDDWNGELVLYAHGFVDADEPLTLPTRDNVPAIRDRMVGLGYAWAYCSYRENGLAVKDGAWSTRRLLKIFKSKVHARPTHTWLMATSLGGLIGVELAEKHPDEFDGIVTLSGMVGGTKAQLDYVGHVRILFDLFYPGVLPGSVIDVPEEFDLYSDVIVPVTIAIQGDPTGLGIISMIQQTPLPVGDGPQVAESLITALAFNYRGIHDILERTNGACPIDNFDTEYVGSLPAEVLAMINANVQRYDRTIPTDNLFDRYYEPSGQLNIPMVSMHNRFDPVVPLFHENLYAAKVAATGNSGNLELRIQERYGHTDFGADFAADEAEEALLAVRAAAGVQ